MKALMVSAPGSSAGKTTVAAALMAALKRRGLAVQPFKCGPDFIDPGHHTLICGRASHNLDTWMLPIEVNRRIFASACRDADVAVVEGMMGLFDGVRGSGEHGSSAEISKLLNLPVVLVVDASSAARSVAAVVHGFRTFDPRVSIVGVILNRVAGPAHANMLKDALREIVPALWVGWLPNQEGLRLEERYLGLHTASERSWTAEILDAMASLIEQNCCLDELMKVCELAVLEDDRQGDDARQILVPSDHPVRIGVARDQAFSFYYEAGLDELRRQGAEIVEFSPLHEDGLPADLDGIYFGGGYPELYADTLSRHKALFTDLHEFAAKGKPVYGECGGLMMLSRELIDKDGVAWPMAGLLPLSIEMTDRLVHFGYAAIEFETDGLAARGTRLHGHSFHCSRVVREGGVAKTATVHYSLSGRSEEEGFAAGSVFGSYVHLHFAADPALAARFVSLARMAQERCKVGMRQ